MNSSDRDRLNHREEQGKITKSPDEMVRQAVEKCHEYLKELLTGLDPQPFELPDKNTKFQIRAYLVKSYMQKFSIRVQHEVMYRRDTVLKFEALDWKSAKDRYGIDEEPHKMGTSYVRRAFIYSKEVEETLKEYESRIPQRDFDPDNFIGILRAGYIPLVLSCFSEQEIADLVSFNRFDEYEDLTKRSSMTCACL
jgi:hypothetical protein